MKVLGIIGLVLLFLFLVAILLFIVCCFKIIADLEDGDKK